MEINNVKVYCIKCSMLVEKLEAINIMKTGFYMSKFLMALGCTKCAQNRIE